MNRFEQLHALLDQKPRANLGFFPTPLVRLNRLSEQLGVNLYVKRDDFSGMSLFGGNKIRILGAQVNVIPGLPGETEAQTEERCHQLGLEHAARLEKEGHRCYDVPMGGASLVGSAAFVGGYLEMMEQCAQMGIASGRKSRAWPSAARMRATRGGAQSWRTRLWPGWAATRA